MHQPTASSVLNAVLAEPHTFEGPYDVYSEFDLARHLERYPAYLEVVISPEGEVEYAVPSHQEKLIAIACNKLNITRQELADRCPPEYYCDFITWLSDITGYLSVWYDGVIGTNVTEAQNAVMHRLKESGAYQGEWYGVSTAGSETT